MCVCVFTMSNIFKKPLLSPPSSEISLAVTSGVIQFYNWEPGHAVQTFDCDVYCNLGNAAFCLVCSSTLTRAGPAFAC